MKISYLLLPLICLFSNSPLLGQNNLEFFRAQFHSIESKKDYESLIDYAIEEHDEQKANIIKAYKAVCKSMMARFTFLPFSKLKRFNEGVDLLENSIAANANVENIYLRLLMQLEVPKILRYHQNIEEDIKFLDEHLKNSDLPLKYKKLMMASLKEASDSQHHRNALEKINLD